MLTPLDCAIQFVPPSVVLKIFPSYPATYPVSIPVKKTDRNVLVALQVWADQSVPPSTVFKITPPEEVPPTAYPVLELVKKTEYKGAVEVFVCVAHMLPSEVCTITPFHPTAQPLFASVK